MEILAGTSKHVVFGGRGQGSPRQGPFSDSRRRPGLRLCAAPRDKWARGREKGKETESCAAQWTERPRSPGLLTKHSASPGAGGGWEPVSLGTWAAVLSKHLQAPRSRLGPASPGKYAKCKVQCCKVPVNSQFPFPSVTASASPTCIFRGLRNLETPKPSKERSIYE